MMHANRDAMIANARAGLRAADIDLPESLAAQLAEADRLDNAPRGDRQTVAEAVADAILAGKNPAEDKRVIAALTAYLLAEAVPPGALHTQATERRVEAFADHADEILEKLATVVAETNETFAAAREVVPDLDVRDHAQAARLSPRQAGPWAQARAALAPFQGVMQAWSHLAGLTHRADPTNPQYRALRVAELTWADLAALGHQPSPEDVLHAGHRLNLATFEEYAERVNRVTEERAEELQKPAQDFQREFKRLRGIYG